MDGQDVMLIGGCIATIGSGTLTNGATIKSDVPTIKPPYTYSVEYVKDPTTDSIYTAISLIEKTIGDLDELAKLPINWDSYGSPQIPSDIINTAKRFARLLEYTPINPPRVVPISGGGVQFEWQIEGRELEIEFIDSENISYLKVDNEEPIEESQIESSDITAIQGLIQWLRGI